MRQARVRMRSNARTRTPMYTRILCVCAQLEAKEAELLEKAEKISAKLAEKNKGKEGYQAPVRR